LVCVRGVTARLVIALLSLGALLAAARGAQAGPAKPTVAVLYFDYAGKDDELAVLRKGLAQMMISDLAGLDAIQLVERSRLEDILAELKLGEDRKLDAATAAKVGKLLGARYLVLGSYFELKTKLRIDARVVEVETGKVIQSVGSTGESDEFFALEKDLVDILIRTLDVKLSSGERCKLRSNATQSFDAWQKYSAGLDAKDRGDADEARRLFQAALDADPSYRAAKTATERLQVIFNRADAAKAAELDKEWKALDPKAPDFAQRVDHMLIVLQSTESAQLKKKVQLLTLLVQRDLTPQLYDQMSRVALEIMSLVWRFDAMPGSEQLLPPVCEYLISRYPKDQSTPMQCKQLLKVLATVNPKLPAATRQSNWDYRWKNATIEWEVAIRDAMPDIVKLFKLCGQKSHRP